MTPDAAAPDRAPDRGPVYAPARPAEPGEIPVIDLTELRTGGAAGRRAVAERIGMACETVGFLYVTGHGVPGPLLDGIFEQARRFFDQPHEVRLKALATLDHWRGYVPGTWDAERGNTGGILDTYRFMLDLPWDDPDVVAGKPHHMPNRWPEGLPGFRETVEAYIDAMLELATVLRGAFATALDLPADWFEPFYRRPLFQLSLLHYRPPPRPEDLEVGVVEHQDTGAFTILLQDGTGGLEIRNRAGEWIAASSVPGAYVINIGDSMMRWTNGRFVSTPHRVVNRSVRPRYSVPFFVNPDYDVAIEPLPHLVPAGEAPRFAPLHNGQYMVDFYDKGMKYLRRGAS